MVVPEAVGLGKAWSASATASGTRSVGVATASALRIVPTSEVCWTCDRDVTTIRTIPSGTGTSTPEAVRRRSHWRSSSTTPSPPSPRTSPTIQV